MTSVISISAHCGDAKEVHVVVTDAGSLVEEFDIANGEKAERYAYDNRVIAVREVAKINRRAKAIEDAEFSLRQATLRYEDAASRGFPLGNEAALKADAIAKLAELDALTATEVTTEVVPTFDPAGHALMGDVHFTAHALVDPRYETKTYSDGTAEAVEIVSLYSIDCGKGMDAFDLK